MPMAKGQPATPEQAMKRGCCPECGEVLDGLDARSHRDNHWPKRPDDTPGTAEALNRWQLMTDYAKDHPSAQI